MNAKAEKNLIIRIIEYGLEKDVFTLNSLKEDLNLDEPTLKFIFNNLFAINDQQSANHLIALVQSIPANLKYQFSKSLNSLQVRLLPNAIFQYSDYLEIKAARQAAKESKKLAWIAIWISLFIGLASLVVGYLQLQQL